MSTDTISKLLAGLTHITWQSAVMMAIGGLLIFLAIAANTVGSHQMW